MIILILKGLRTSMITRVAETAVFIDTYEQTLHFSYHELTLEFDNCLKFHWLAPMSYQCSHIFPLLNKIHFLFWGN